MIDLEKLTCLEETEKNNFRWFLRESVARKASSNIWGKGFTFQSNNEKVEKIFKRFDFNNNLINTLSYVEKLASMYGRAIITINKTEGGDIYLNVASPFYFQGIGKVFATPQLAVVYQKVNISNVNYILKTTYTTKIVKNEIFYNQDGDILVFDQEAKILKELRMKKEWVHNLGFVPLLELTNLPFYQLNVGNWEYVTITDWYPAAMWEDVAYVATKHFKKELVYNHSRILLTNADQRLIDQIRNQEYNDTGVDIADMILETSTGAEAKIQPTNADFYKYTSAINQILDFYFKMCGSSKFSEGGGAQKTVAETATIRSQMIENIQQKILLRENQLTRLIKMVLKAYGVANDDFVFKINGNILKDDNAYIDQLIKKYEIGAISIIDIISDIFGLNEIEAKEKYKSIKKFNEENGIELFSSSSFNLDGEDKINEAGEHIDNPDKRGEA